MNEQTAQAVLGPQLTIVDRWIEFLKSGRFQQARNYLHTPSGYCCMGVLVEAAGYEWSDTALAGNGHSPHYAMLTTGATQRVIRRLLEEWGVHPDWQEALVLANDNEFRRANFEEIAQFLEAHKAELSETPRTRWRWSPSEAAFVEKPIGD